MNVTYTDQTHPWFAVQTRTRYENLAAKQLSGRGYEVFLPFYQCKRRWSDRMQEFDVPLFPGYLFCRFNLLRPPFTLRPGQHRSLGNIHFARDFSEANACRISCFNLVPCILRLTHEYGYHVVGPKSRFGKEHCCLTRAVSAR